MNRRDFLLRTGKAGLAVAAACGTGIFFHNRQVPQNRPPAQAAWTVPDFSVPEQAGRICAVRGKDRSQTVQAAIKALGGMGLFVKPGERVLLKVNAAFASPPMISATSHPDLVAEVVRLCFQAGAARVVVTDNPINDPSSCFSLSGIGPAAETAGASIVLPREEAFRPVTLAEGRLIRDWPVLAGPFEGIDRLIGIAPVKDHYRSGASMTMKNWYGLLGGRRNMFHQDIHTIITELARMVKPTLVILDGTVSMMQNGPTGGSLSDLKPTETMIVGTDQVAVDAYGATLLEKNREELSYIGMAQHAGVGTADLDRLKPIVI